jgi:16S rRNA processing protein RimM
MTDKLVVLGEITGIHGVKGWLRIRSYTEPEDNILHYQPWLLTRPRSHKPPLEVTVVEHKLTDKGLLVQLSCCDDRDLARQYMGMEILVARSRLPALPEGEYYWADLEGLTVITRQGIVLGIVSYLFATGSNDILVVSQNEKQRLIPYLRDQVIKRVDLTAGIIEVDWDPEF